MMYKILNQQIAIPLPDYIKHKARATRSQHRLKFTRLRTSSDSYKYSFFPRTMKTGMSFLNTSSSCPPWSSSRRQSDASRHQVLFLLAHFFIFVHISAPTYIQTVHRPPSAAAPLVQMLYRL